SSSRGARRRDHRTACRWRRARSRRRSRPRRRRRTKRSGGASAPGSAVHHRRSTACRGRAAVVTRAIVISDVHANLVALEAVLRGAGADGELWVTGDTVGYGPDPADVLALLRERNAFLVAGNHDL